MRTIRQGDQGEDVRDVQHRLLALAAQIDPEELQGGRFGPSTLAAVRAFQQRRGLIVDGRVGPETWGELVEAGYAVGDRVLYLRYPHFRGDDVRALQRRLNALGFDAGREDGIFGDRTERAVREFQRNVGREPDGIVGPETVQAVERLRPDLAGPSRAVVREAEAVARMNLSLDGARVAIDPGHGPSDPGRVGAAGEREADLTLLLGRDLADELRAVGAEPILLRDGDEDPSPTDRARRANEEGAEVCVSIHLNGEDDPAAEGASCFYYGTEDTHSPAGHRLADLIQDELTSRMGLLDGRTHPLGVTLLRETRMPAVQVEPCFLTNPREERLLAQPGFRRDIAVAVTHGLRR
ncbi:MAG: N-acetylmuramoyl-L-alanine amidase, partial [Actinobacteria bacterium]|nr:N-acetylmuramoyl-L-alanine amidase [Actinomycetota bacterium]